VFELNETIRKDSYTRVNGHRSLALFIAVENIFNVTER